MRSDRDYQQLPLFAPLPGTTLRDRGVALAASAQDVADPLWREMAYAALVRVARSQHDVHVDDVRREFSLTPHHPNAWGAIWMRALRDGVIGRTGRLRATRQPGKHAHQYPIYCSFIVGQVGKEQV